MSASAGSSRPRPDAAERRRVRLGIFERVSELGASAQASIPGIYAWAVTVAPAAWARGAPWIAKTAAIAGLVALASAAFIERQAPAWARIASVWGLVLSSALVWALVPGALSAAHLDAVRGMLGMVGWALFAFASAAPALKRDPKDAERVVPGALLRPRGDVPRGDGVFVAIGILLAAALQTTGWSVVSPERALLVRLVALAAGLSVIGAMTSISLSRHSRPKPAKRGRRLRRALPWLAALAMLALFGAMVALTR